MRYDAGKTKTQKGFGMVRKAFTLTALLIAANCAHAAQWKMIGALHSSTLSIDMASVSRARPIVKFWQKEEWVLPTVSAGISTPASMRMTRFSINCKESTFALGATTFYDASGGVIQSQHGEPDVWDAIPPDSIVDTMREMMCKPT